MDKHDLRDELTHILLFPENFTQLISMLLDWFIKKFGTSNVGIWLDENNEGMNLVGYMKCTDYYESIKTILEEDMVPGIIKTGLSCSNNWSRKGLALDKPYSFVGFPCNYQGHTVATIILFRPRDEDNLFNSQTEDLIALCEPLIVCGFAKILKWDRDKKPRTSSNPLQKSEKKDPADWWKKGEEPPF